MPPNVPHNCSTTLVSDEIGEVVGELGAVVVDEGIDGIAVPIPERYHHVLLVPISWLGRNAALRDSHDAAIWLSVTFVMP